jgi:hypothetical protein
VTNLFCSQLLRVRGKSDERVGFSFNEETDRIPGPFPGDPVHFVGPYSDVGQHAGDDDVGAKA